MSWGSWEKTAEQGPWPFFRRCAVFVFMSAILISVLSWAFGWFNQAGQVATEELSPRVLLKRYEWFKDAASALDARLASIKVYESRFDSLKSSYGNKARHEWSRADQEQWNVWSQESAGMKASYNNLAAEYNAAMAKINYRFCNVGDVPAGGQPLPREFRAYEEK